MTGTSKIHRAFDYRCQLYLPKEVADKAFIPHPTTLFQDDYIATLKASAQGYPETELYNVLKICCYPDPPDFHIARFKDWIRQVDPAVFPKGTVQDAIKERIHFFLKDREDIIKSYCKQNNLKVNAFQKPIFETGYDQIFGKCGPQSQWIDCIDRWLRSLGAPLSWMLRAGIYTLTIEVIFFFVRLQLFAEAFSCFLVLLAAEFVIQYCSSKSFLRRARQQPIIQPLFDMKLRFLLQDLKDLKHLYVGHAAQKLGIPELKEANTTITRSRPHISKNAYSIKIISKMVLRSKLLGWLIKPENMSMTIELIGQSINATPIAIVWFDAPKSIFFAKKAIDIIKYERDEMCRLFCYRLDFRTYSISGTIIKEYEEKKARHFLQYWPVPLNSYHINKKFKSAPARLYTYKKKTRKDDKPNNE